MERTPETVLDNVSSGELGHDLRVVVTSGPDEGRAIGLRIDQPVIVGISRSCDLVLTDPRVSRKHLQLMLTRDGVQAVDLGSKNGTYYLGVRLGTAVITPHTSLRLGRSALRVESESTPAGKRYPDDRLEALLGASAAMHRVFYLIEKLAPTDVTVLITGETGCGKELVAEALHKLSPRRSEPLVVAAMNSVNPGLIQSELFGHVRGAFTGAARDREGLLLQAGRGTAFLDEIGDLPIDSQPVLLRALEARTVRPVGDTRDHAIACRFLAATNRDLRDEVDEGQFREDLLYRLAGAEIQIPPLRERPDDIALLARHFVASSARPVTLPPATLSALVSYDWPGNVRQLRNVLERALALTPDGGELTHEAIGLGDESAARASGASSSMSISFDVPFKQAKDLLVDRWERAYLDELLRRSDGNISRAARLGGMHRVHLHKLLRRHGLKEP